MFEQMKKSKDKVSYLLRNHPKLRDSDYKLIATYWHKEIGEDISSMSAFDLLKKIAEGKLTSSESIRRVRQKIQEDNPELRGEVWLNKQLKSEEVRENIKHL
jgi:hypothetical protein